MFKLAFASCAKFQHQPVQPAWDDIRHWRPDALLLLGDNVYLDHDRHGDPLALAAELRRLYAQQLAVPSFKALLDDLRLRQAPVIAIYDDHDFLGNNRCGGDEDPALREAARQEFVNAFKPLMTGADVYSCRSLGANHLIDLIVLDERFYRNQPALAGGSRNAILGAQQWTWFEQQVQQSQARYLVVASSTTVHTFGDEAWEQYPGAFQRLVQLLGKRQGALVLSGDVHRNAAYDDSGLIEIVSSAVARNGIVFGAERRNFGLLSFDAQGVDVKLESLKASWRFNFRIPSQPWALP